MDTGYPMQHARPLFGTTVTQDGIDFTVREESVEYVAKYWAEPKDGWYHLSSVDLDRGRVRYLLMDRDGRLKTSSNHASLHYYWPPQKVYEAMREAKRAARHVAESR
jgi:hypothetical protein